MCARVCPRVCVCVCVCVCRILITAVAITQPFSLPSLVPLPSSLFSLLLHLPRPPLSLSSACAMSSAVVARGTVRCGGESVELSAPLPSDDIKGTIAAVAALKEKLNAALTAQVERSGGGACEMERGKGSWRREKEKEKEKKRGFCCRSLMLLRSPSLSLSPFSLTISGQ